MSLSEFISNNSSIIVAGITAVASSYFTYLATKKKQANDDGNLMKEQFEALALANKQYREEVRNDFTAVKEELKKANERIATLEKALLERDKRIAELEYALNLKNAT